MKGVFKKALGAFVELDAEEERPKVSIPPKTIEVQSMVTSTSTSVSSSEIEEFTKQFRDILADENKRNHPGNDYYEFVAMKNVMSAIPQEDMRYKAAFAGWSIGGNLDKSILLSTAQKYLGLVQREMDEFEVAYQTKYNQTVVANEKVIEEKTKRIIELNEEVSKLNGEISSLKQQNLLSTKDLSSKHDAFMVAGNTQKNEINEEIQKINNYIN